MPHQRALSGRLLYLVLWHLFCVLNASAGLVNVTLDDADTAIIYAPLSQWNIGGDCPTCTAHPDANQTFAGTWHDSSFPGGGQASHITSASFAFEGTAIYVYCIIAHSFASPNGNTDMTFFIDGSMVGSFSLAPSGAMGYDYNIPVYANQSIQPGTHSFSLVNGHVGGTQSLILLDYIIFSQESAEASVATVPALPSSSRLTTSSPVVDSTSTSPLPSTSPDTGTNRVPSGTLSDTPSNIRTIAIVASVCGVAVLLAAVALLVCFCVRRRRRAVHHEASLEPDIAENPLTSGWTGGTWGAVRVSGELEHPSLAQTRHLPRDVRGDPSARERERSRRGRAAKKRLRSLTESSTATASSMMKSPPTSSHSQRPSTGTTSASHSSPPTTANSARTKEHRHPYAARNSEFEPGLDPPSVTRLIIREQPSVTESEEPTSFVPDLDDESSESQETNKHASTQPPTPGPVTPTLQNAPVPTHALVPALPQTRPRPLPMRPVLESQAKAARVRRHHSVGVYSPSRDVEFLPAYEPSQRP